MESDDSMRHCIVDTSALPPQPSLLPPHYHTVSNAVRVRVRGPFLFRSRLLRHRTLGCGRYISADQVYMHRVIDGDTKRKRRQ